MPRLSLIKAFLGKSSLKGIRTTVLGPIGWAIFILLGALLTAHGINAPVWIMIILAVFLCLFVILFFIAYIYCLITDKDSLRSEFYSIQKFAIEKGYGDSVFGEITTREPSKSLKYIPEQKQENEQ